MTIGEIAETLNACATGKGCRYCPHLKWGDCQAHLIKDMAAECQKLEDEE